MGDGGGGGEGGSGERNVKRWGKSGMTKGKWTKKE